MYARLESMSVSQSLLCMDEHNFTYFEGPLYTKMHTGSHRQNGCVTIQTQHRNTVTKNNLQNCALLRYYAASIGYFVPTFRNNLSVPIKTRPIYCAETSVINKHYSLRNNPEECRSHLLRGGRLKSR